MENKIQTNHIYVRLFISYMSSNELENLMSQLHVDSQLNVLDVHNLGIKQFGTSKARWSYKEEQNFTRDGHERSRPLRDIDPNKTYDPPVYYVPKFGNFLLDDKDNYLTIPKIVTKESGLEFDNLTKNDLWAMFWLEHWGKQSYKRAFNGLIKNRPRRGGGGGLSNSMRRASLAIIIFAFSSFRARASLARRACASFLRSSRAPPRRWG
jgi:hypothetical protein